MIHAGEPRSRGEGALAGALRAQMCGPRAIYFALAVVVAAGLLLALRYGVEVVLSLLGGRMAERWGAERLLVMMWILTAVTLTGFGLGWLWS